MVSDASVKAPVFSFRPNQLHWLGGEARVFSVDSEDDFSHSRDFSAARLLNVAYEGGGIGTLFDQIADAGLITKSGSFQALLENLEDLSKNKPLIVFVRNSDRLLADIGPALIHIVTGWEGFTRHAGGVSSMYLVLETGPRATVHAAFYPGGKVDWR